jgi:hypothetical protein
LDLAKRAADAFYSLKVFQKRAYTLEDALKVLQVAKARKMPKGFLRIFEEAEIPRVTSLHTPSPDIFGFKQSFPANVEKALAKGSIVQTAPAAKVLRQGLSGLPLTPQENIMVESITKGHELDELAASYGNTPYYLNKHWHEYWSHASPDVILKEHNRLVTLPEHLKQGPLKLFQELRSGPLGEANALSNYIDYGNSPRLSRHARKRILERITKDQYRAYNDAYDVKDSVQHRLLRSPEHAAHEAEIKNRALELGGDFETAREGPFPSDPKHPLNVTRNAEEALKAQLATQGLLDLSEALKHR